MPSDPIPTEDRSILERLSAEHSRDLFAAMQGGYDSNPVFIDAKTEIERLRRELARFSLEPAAERKDAAWLLGCEQRLREVAQYLRSHHDFDRMDADAACDVERAARALREIACPALTKAAEPIRKKFGIGDCVISRGGRKGVVRGPADGERAVWVLFRDCGDVETIDGGDLESRECDAQDKAPPLNGAAK
jgi:hypothetical protein